ncbi:hypothetical protein K440DRAFT_665201 [Wilcoxina mikolae CBS 423.85]|nr:hypothetical protein K440DRAFT_665201 [Wilcoxina mikolae CBS 423.85]
MRSTFYTLLALSLSTLTWGAPTPGNRAVYKREDSPSKHCEMYPEGIPGYGCQPEAPYSEDNQGEGSTYGEHGKEGYSHGMGEKDHEKDDYGFGELHHFLYEATSVVKRGDEENPCAKSYEYAYDNDLRMCKEYERESLKEKYSQKGKNAKHDGMFCASTYAEAYYKNLIMCKDLKKNMPDHKNKGKDGGAPEAANPANPAGLPAGLPALPVTVPATPQLPAVPVTVPAVVPQTAQGGNNEKRDDKMHPKQDDHDHKEKKCAQYYMEAYHEKLPMCDDYYRMLHHGDKQDKGQDGGDGGNGDILGDLTDPVVGPEPADTFGSVVQSLPVANVLAAPATAGGAGGDAGALSTVTSATGGLGGGLPLAKREDKTDDDTTKTKNGKKTTAYKKDDKDDVSVDKITEETKAKVLEKVKTLKEVKDGKKAKDSDKETKDGEGKYKGKGEKKEKPE